MASTSLSRGEARALAAKLRLRKPDVALAVTDEFLRRHPDWLERLGDAARVRGLEDAGYHVDFLAGSIECGRCEPFEDYARWTCRVLGARGIAPSFVAENLGQVEARLAPSLAPAEQAAVTTLVAAALRACAAAPAATPWPQETPATPRAVREEQGLALARSLFLQAILAGRRKAAATVASEALAAGHPVPDLYVDVFQESLYEVGRLWEANRVTVAEEHMATAITQFVLAETYSRIEIPGQQHGRAVVAGVQGELHQVGGNMVADMLETEGWDVRFLGTNVPQPGVLRALEEHSATLLGITATMLFNLPSVAELIETVHRHFGADRPRVIVGGGAFRVAPGLWSEIGADGHAGDLRGAVAAARG